MSHHLVKKRKPGRPKGFAIALPKEDLIRAYEEGSSIRKLAKEFGVAYATVRTRLLGWGVKMRPMGWSSSAREKVLEDNPGDVRLHILQLEEAIYAKREVVTKREAELKQAQEKEPKEASAAVTKLKQADVELRDFEEELATLKGVGAR